MMMATKSAWVKYAAVVVALIVLAEHVPQQVSAIQRISVKAGGAGKGKKKGSESSSGPNYNQLLTTMNDENKKPNPLALEKPAEPSLVSSSFRPSICQSSQ
eukprot:TRINITY_DN46616_c0_g1_i2.p3 TRINITY_DN46616_c0_g1~~TRINITY_DN46616_c0_g1_i2.p3  ORF type:complete len:101 (-),score=32.70 TRINITY_DN46616_c0_g1_i2:593-895(-)